MKEQMKRIMALLNDRFSKYGFERKEYNFFVRTIEGNIAQNIAIGTPRRSKNGTFYLSPSVGILYRDVNNIQLKLKQLESQIPDYIGYMIALPIGYLMPEKTYLEWKFTKDEDVTEEVNKMADAIIKYGLPYHEELSNRDQLIYGLAIGKYNGEREYMLPILYYLNGNYKRALECADDFIRKLSAQTSQEDCEIIKMLGGVNEEVHIVNNGLKSYLEFVENLKLLIEQQEHL